MAKIKKASAGTPKSKQLRSKNKQANADARRARVAELLLQSKTYREIASTVGVRSTKTIHDDVTAIMVDWKAQQQHHVSEWMALELERVGRIEAQAWEAWARSQEDAETHTLENGKDGKRETFTTKGQAGDPRFLDVILKCVTRRCELLGLDAPKEISVPGLVSPEEMEKRRKERWQKVVPELAVALSLERRESAIDA